MTFLTFSCFLAMTVWLRQSEAATSTLFNMIDPPLSGPSGRDNENTPVNLGVQFFPTVSGFVTAVMFYKNNSAPIARVCSLFTLQGVELARVTLPSVNETRVRTWQICHFDTPVAVVANVDYIASVWTYGYARSTSWFRPVDVTVGDLVLRRRELNGRYAYANVVAFPGLQFNANYWTDVRFETTIATPTPPPPTATPPAPALDTTSPQAIFATLTTTTTTVQFNDNVTGNVSQSPGANNNTATGTANVGNGAASDIAMWVGIGVGLCCLLLLLLLLLLVCLARRRKSKQAKGEQHLETPTTIDTVHSDIEMDRYSEYGGIGASSIIEQPTNLPAASRTQIYASIPRKTIIYEDCTSVLR
jgi:hypothetical protein